MENNIKLEEQLISFETGKLAKEKGFNIPCKYFYKEKYINTIEYEVVHDGHLEANWNENFKYSPAECSAPTQSLLQKWLRELHGVDIHITRNKPSYREYRVEIYKVDNTPNYIYFQINEENSKFCKWFDDYEEALEASLLEALKLIK